MNLSTKAIGWHFASIAAGAWGMAVFAQSNSVDLYALLAQFKKTWGDLIVLSGMVAPFLAAGAAAYRTWGAKQVPKDTVAVAPSSDAPLPVGTITTLGKVVGALLIGLLLAAAPSDVYAQGLKGIAQKNDVNRPGGVQAGAPSVATDINTLVDKFYATSRDDLTSALGYAAFAEDKSAVACYTEWLKQVDGMIKLRETYPDAKEPQLLTAFQKARNLIKRLETDSPLRQACAALAADAKSDVQNLISKLVTGAAIKAFLPIPLP